MNKKTFFLKALLAVAFVFLTISASLAEDINVTVKVVGKGTVSYNNKSASNGQSFTISAALSYFIFQPSFEIHNSILDFDITYPDGYIVEVEKKLSFADSPDDISTFKEDNSTYSCNMPFEGSNTTSMTLTFTFKELFRGGTESSPIVLSDNTVTYLAGGWYTVKNNITFDHDLSSYGDIHLSIAKNVTMTIDDEDGFHANKNGLKLTILGEGMLNITAISTAAIRDFAYEQISGNVVLTTNGSGIQTQENVEIKGGTFTTNSSTGIYSIDNNKKCKITISGGNVNINATEQGLYSQFISITGGVVNVNYHGQEQDLCYIYVTDRLCITGGQVTAQGEGIKGAEEVVLGCSSADDFIKASKYNVADNVVSIAEGQTLKDEDGNLYSGTLTSEQVAAIEGEKLTLLTAGGVLTLTQNQTGITADLQGEFAYSEEGFLTITDRIKVKKVTFKRSFSPGIPATVMFPFSFEWTNSQSIGSF